MKILRRILTLFRRTALALVLAAFVVSEMGMVTLGRGNRPSFTDSSGITSAAGVFLFERVQTVGAPPLQEPLQFQFRWHSDPYFRSMVYRFPWSTLGFRFRSARSPGYQYQLSLGDPLGAPTMVTRPPFDYFDIMIPYWAPLLLLALPEVLWLMRLGRARALRHLAQTPAVPAAADDSIIARDLPCVHCGYNLRTLPRSGRCTECGSAIVDTLNLNAELARSRPGWLKWLAAGNAMLLLVRVVLLLIYAALYAQELDSLAPTAVVASVLYLAGIVCLTRPEHPFIESPDKVRVRWQRILAMVMVILVAAATWHQSYGGRGGSGILGMFVGIGYTFHPMTLELMLYAWLIFCALVVMEYFFLAHLAGRLLDRFMTEHCKIAGIGAAAGGVVVIFVVRPLATNQIPWNLLGLWAFCGVVVLWQLFAIWAAFMNGYCAVRFMQQAWIAEQNWQRQQALLAAEPAR